MAWNEPGGGNRDPWNSKGGDQGPPDLDEVVRKLQDKMGGLFGGKRGGGGGNDGGSGMPGGAAGKKGIGLIIALVLVAVLGFEAFYIIQPAERGVVKRFGAYHTVTSPGPHLKLPFVDTVDVVNVDQVNKFQHRAQMLTKDENIADVTLEVQFRIQDAADFLFQDADPGNTIHGAMESSLREVIGKSRLDEIITENRSGIALAVQSGTQELLDLYRKLRPGELTTVESARGLIQTLFKNPKRYDLTRVGRYKLDQKFGISDEPSDYDREVDGLLSDLDLPVTALFSTLGRTAARGLEASWTAHKMRTVFDELMANLRNGDSATANMDQFDPSTWPAEVTGLIGTPQSTAITSRLTVTCPVSMSTSTSANWAAYGGGDSGET